ncbi:MAG: ABC transporter permease, partial [Bacillota bacterium]|nr:ABC transporter permease [Bacillota bacterium]
MYNYIRAELYRNFNRKYLWVYTGFFAFASLAINLLASVNEGNSAISLNILFGITIAMFIMPVYLVVPMLDMAAAEENKNQTLRNVITFGMPRNKIILSKVIVAVVLSLISAAIVLVVFFGSGAVLFGLGKDFSATLSDFLIR